MRFRTALFATLCSVAVLYVAGAAIVIHKSPPQYSLAYGFDERNILLGPPRSLVIRYVVCCKDVGTSYADDYLLIDSTLAVASVRDQSDPRDLEAIAKEVVRTLVEKRDLNVNWVDPRTGQTPLHGAIHSAELWQVEFLLELGANPCVRVSNQNRIYAGLNALELSQNVMRRRLTETSPENFSLQEQEKQIRSLLEESVKSCDDL